MHQNVSLRCSVQVVTAIEFIDDTTRGIVAHTLVQFHCGIATHVSFNGIGTSCTLTAAVCIVSNGTTGQLNLSTLLDLAHLTATIDIIANGAACDVHLSPNTGSKRCRIILPVFSSYTRERTVGKHYIARTAASAIHTACDSSTFDVHGVA